ncbi:hypothetical protein [Salinibacterium sp. ZJ450]|uniref:hypothetical protein n=1 Tax=Salinibacterium sp. ZJ450 TaxID=2708338 RepID=UPI00141EC436|nr:hypothetical protein [Salinibacterium sp. ZJ450]
MPTDRHPGANPHEAELRASLQRSAAHTPLPGIDSAAVIRRSRGRRTPKLVAAGGIFSLAVLGIGVASVTGLQNLGSPFSGTAGSSQESATDSGLAAPDAATVPVPADRLNPCGGSLAPPSTDADITLTVQFPTEAAIAAGSISGQVTLTNTGSDRLVASSAAVAPVTLSQDGTVLWHTNGPMILSLATIDLAPGESFSWQASVLPAHCTDEATLETTAPESLPPVDPGLYQVSAAVDLSLPNGTVRQLSGTPADITLR